MGISFTTLLLRKSGMNDVYTVRRLTQLFEKKGYVPVDNPDRAELTLSLYTQEGRRWQLLTGEPEVLERYAAEIAAVNRAEALLVNCVDSDFVLYTLYDPAKGTRTVACAGELYGDGDAPAQKVEQALWQSAAHTKKKVDFSELFGRERDFAEESLTELGEAFGFDGRAVTDAADGGAEPDISLSFSPAGKQGNSAGTKKKKRKGLNTAFMEIYGELLAPYGFVKIRGKQPYLGRLIGGEILQVITCLAERTDKWHEYDAFYVLCEVATVYRQYFNLDKAPRDNIFLKDNSHLYAFSHPFERDEEYCDSIFFHRYEKGDGEAMLRAIRDSFGVTKEIMLPILDSVTDLRSCMEYFRIYNGSVTIVYGADENWNNNCIPDQGGNEGLLNLKLYSPEEYAEIEKRQHELACAEEEYGMKTGRYGFTPESLEKKHREDKEEREQMIALFKRITGDAEEYAMAMEELERRRSRNLNTLRSYGFDV